ncbi:helix-turn-helix transcriptional regulator [Streptomyces europaeiscabiei]|uniref:Helix-turn-helix transcriptional regulator n=1 Tax=Streptomyces europaeiscabiei TaxID=146819 RepID=A0ABU4N670_9ACTN|nr:helix-turn-helix transcriptional regulator [Streptomyces europaeiscabiei]MDX3542134.1 helix-turn-helix transcriptional regulator [Streptomyces europaeiscabiei]MDX3551182.1 helix-turn-helix transcriptional regulator [Streptomyces europaeiscabiei]MDX3698258.1 helix-turn-helix transcriptional regulator [Streptomyces europaeiscabiei]MDX3835511.1 helix-turn-helix transcriptional regulator [Streptomyces europaeiscabiei]MDX3842447.1 helix-turn-helix transcriptional regulator [Streptomyces europaei
MTGGGKSDDHDEAWADEGTVVDREPDPSDSLRTWGAVTQALREHAGYSRAEFADLVRFSRHMVESVEQGRRMPDVTYVERADELLGNTGALRRSSQYVTRGRGDVGLAAWFRQWARLERVAVSLCTYECRLVPGLLQSRDYARAVFEGTVPVTPDDQLDNFMDRRMERQRMLFERSTTPFSFIVEEHVLRRRFGDDARMRGLFDHVLELSAPRNVTLQIVPLEAGLHACLDGPVQLLETPKGQRLAYSEGQQNGRLISDSKEVGLLHQRYDTLRSQALNAKDSRALLERLRGEPDL